GHADEFVVFEAVANDGGVSPVGECQYSEQFGLRAGFKTEIERLAKIENLLYDVPLLIHLDGVDAVIGPLVPKLGHGRAKGLSTLGHTMTEDIGEADQNRKLDAAGLKLIDKFFQID